MIFQLMWNEYSTIYVRLVKLEGDHPLLTIRQIEAIDSMFMLALPLNCTTVFPKCTYHPDLKVGLTNKSKNTNNTLEIEPNHIRISIMWSRINLVILNWIDIYGKFHKSISKFNIGPFQCILHASNLSFTLTNVLERT